MPSIEIIDVNPSNVDEFGFFCAMSKPELLGYRDKLVWLEKRFREGLKIKLIRHGGRGFIEYVPGKFAWRGIVAPQYMVIHCMWVVGRAKGKGQGKVLLEACIGDARAAKLNGVAAVTARKRVGFVDTDFFVHHGFQVVQTTGGMDLVALKFSSTAPDPRFIGDWERKGSSFGEGLTVVSSPQCPYTYEGAQQVVAIAQGQGMVARAVKLNSLKELRQSSPSPYASFDMVYNGRVISNLFHCMTANRLRRLVGGDNTSSSKAR